MFKNKTKLAVIGLGYVGLPLAVEFAKKRLTIAFDIKKKRIEELKSGIDKTLELSNLQIKRAKKLVLTSSKKDLKLANCYIVAVPTPIDKLKRPDLKLLNAACKMIASFLKKDDIEAIKEMLEADRAERRWLPSPAASSRSSKRW